MNRFRWPLLISTVLVGLMWTGTSLAQNPVVPTDHSLQPVGVNDMQSSAVVAMPATGFSWVGAWSMGQFGVFQFQSWGGVPDRSWSGRASVAVLRERRGLLR